MHSGNIQTVPRDTTTTGSHGPVAQRIPCDPPLFLSADVRQGEFGVIARRMVCVLSEEIVCSLLHLPHSLARRAPVLWTVRNDYWLQSGRLVAHTYPNKHVEADLEGFPGWWMPFRCHTIKEELEDLRKRAHRKNDTRACMDCVRIGKTVQSLCSAVSFCVTKGSLCGDRYVTLVYGLLAGTAP